MTPFLRDVDLRIAHVRRGGGEKEHLQNINKVKPEQLKLRKSYPSIWS
jgi:hypothetical protein